MQNEKEKFQGFEGKHTWQFSRINHIDFPKLKIFSEHEIRKEGIKRCPLSSIFCWKAFFQKFGESVETEGVLQRGQASRQANTQKRKKKRKEKKRKEKSVGRRKNFFCIHEWKENILIYKKLIERIWDFSLNEPGIQEPKIRLGTLEKKIWGYSKAFLVAGAWKVKKFGM